LLVERGILTPLALGGALALQRRSGNRVATECYFGHSASEEDLLACLSEQIGVPGVNLSSMVLPLTVLDVMPEQAAVKQNVLPVRKDGERLFLAMADPLDQDLLSEVAFVSHRQVVACVALQGPLRRTIAAAYEAKRRGELDYRGDQAAETDGSLAPVRFVYPPSVTRVPPELLPPVAAPVPGESPAGTDPVVIRVDDGLSGDLVIPFDDDDLAAENEEPDLPPGEDQTAEGSAQDPDSPGAAGSRGRVPTRGGVAVRALVVDDDAELRRLIVRVLNSKGVETQEAGRGLEALNLIKQQPPDLVLLDAMLPEVHGFDICRKMKSSDRYGHIPVIMISSVYRGWRVARDLKDTYGVDAFLEKPFSLDALWNTVERALSNRSRTPHAAHQIAAAGRAAYRQAVACFRTGDLEGAIEHCLRGVRMDPLSPRLHFRLGAFYLRKKGMTYQALQELEEAVALDPDLFSAQRILAILYQRKGFRNKAIDMWERALRSSPSDETREQIRSHLRTLL
jgi:DNA-binding response OmpR family regulator